MPSHRLFCNGESRRDDMSIDRELKKHEHRRCDISLAKYLREDYQSKSEAPKV